MALRRRARLLPLLALTATLALSNPTANAQSAGHYVEGVTGSTTEQLRRPASSAATSGM